jgi:MFS family permease
VPVAIGGFGTGFLNPVLGAIFFERVPGALIGRVGALQNSLCWSGVPLGGISAAAAISLFGLGRALVIAGGIFRRVVSKARVEGSCRGLVSKSRVERSCRKVVSKGRVERSCRKVVSLLVLTAYRPLS